MRFNCKVWPGSHHAAFPKEIFHWAPLLNVRLIYRHSPPSKPIETWVDSGGHACLFHAGICRSLGISNVEEGIEEPLGGIVGGPKISTYFHKIKILVGSEQFETMVGFSWRLSVAGILGRRGFFENFIVKIDSSTNPPSFDLEKIHRT